MTDFLRHFLADEAGATMVEYALVASMIVIAVIAGFNILAPSDWYTNLNQAIADQMPS